MSHQPEESKKLQDLRSQRLALGRAIRALERLDCIRNRRNFGFRTCRPAVRIHGKDSHLNY
jgi:hypothetical protein